MHKMVSSDSADRNPSVTAWLKLVDGDVLLVFTLALFAAGSMRFFEAGLYNAQKVLEVNAGELLAFVAIYSVIKSKSETIVLSRADFAILSACALSFLPPEPRLSFLGAAIAGIYFWRRAGQNTQLASVGQLWVAVSVYELWGPLFFRIVSAPIIQAEVALISKVGELLGFGLNMDGVLLRSPSGWFVIVIEGCSSFHNVSLALLVWLSLLKLGGAQVGRSNLAALGVGVIMIVCLNALQILLMTASEEEYGFWHTGNGAILFSCLTLAAISFPTMISLRRRENE